MRLLLTNDDGVYAPGLAALHAALCELHEVVVVAPETEQSAVGHAITLADPIKVRRLGPRTGFTGWAVTGTPADCVKLAVRELMETPPEMVVSGINLGANVGVNVLYSGTVSAASEGAILGLPSLALSLAFTPATIKNPDFSFAGRFAAHLVEQYPSLGVPPEVSLNVNFPPVAGEKIKGVRFTRQSNARLKEIFHRRTDPRGHVYYWQGGEMMGKDGDAATTDFPALLAGYVTITPVRHDLTHEEVLDHLGRASLSLPSGT
jgi:5'-nucleotidase